VAFEFDLLASVAFADYSLRQSALVLARMPMKLGKKMVEANTVVMIAKYMVFLLERARSVKRRVRRCARHLAVAGDRLRVI
jgi:hypothetical protein